MRRYELAANAILLLPIIITIGLCCMMTWPINIVLIATCNIIGLTDLVYAKYPLISRGVFCSFGPKLIPVERRWAYFAGYKFIGIGCALNALVLLQMLTFSIIQ
jgi:hypothetical protein